MRPSKSPFTVTPAGMPVLVDIEEGAEAAGARIKVFGDLDRVGAHPLQRAVIHVLREQRPAHLELDLAGVPFLDTGGIRVLLQCRADAQQLDCEIGLTNVQPLVFRVLEIVRLLEAFALDKPTAP